ncbi:MAG: glycosyltransferase family 2 protein [Bacteroidia bacterium]
MAPIILFVYNRPALAGQTLQSLKENNLASASDLFIFSDGPKEGDSEENKAKVSAVREVIREQNWCRTVTIIEQPKNKGLAASVTDGVTEIVSKYGKVIVVEDDVLLSRHFLQFMNDSLDTYADDPKVLAVGSWNYFQGNPQPGNEIFFFRYPDSIAWATFDRSWKLFEKDAELALKKLIRMKRMRKFNGDGDAPYFENMLNMQISGKINSWAIRWTATSIINDMLSVFPAQTLSKHIGFGAEATHETSDVDYNSGLVLAEKKIEVTRLPPVENEEALNAWKKFVKTNFLDPAGIKPPLPFARRAVNALGRRMKNFFRK